MTLRPRSPDPLRPPLVLVFFLLTFAACSVTNDANMPPSLVEYEVRDATRGEANQMGRCLRMVYRAQHDYYQEHGHFTRSVKKLNLGKYCKGVYVSMQPAGEQFYATGKINREADYTTVKWTINENGQIEKHNFFDFPF